MIHGCEYVEKEEKRKPKRKKREGNENVRGRPR
jgi:hypothetical protein